MIIITVGEIKSSAVITILQEETSYSFFQKSQLGTIVFENYNTNACVNERNVVTYSERVTRFERIVAKGGKVNLLAKLDNFPSLKIGQAGARRSVFRHSRQVKELTC